MPAMREGILGFRGLGIQEEATDTGDDLYMGLLLLMVVRTENRTGGGNEKEQEDTGRVYLTQ